MTKIRLATFNVENLFERPRALNRPRWEEGQPALDAAKELNDLFEKEHYSDADKRRMLELLDAWELLATRPASQLLELQRIRGHLFRLTKDEGPQIIADGRADWVGWVELKKEAIHDQAIENTARVIKEVNPDILVLVEVEHRPALQRFADGFLRPANDNGEPHPYQYNMVIDGNDPRGIDVGILSRFPITRISSHIADTNQKQRRVFSRDCPEYFIELPNGEQIVVLPNHFSSKGSDLHGARRREQAHAVRTIYQRLRKQHELVVVAGDLNDHPMGGSLNPLLQDGSELVDAMSLPIYDGFPGTYEHANATQKLDYLLMSPALRAKVTQVDVFRKGFYAPTKWESFENINKTTKDRFQASDHHCVWADVNL